MVGILKSSEIKVGTSVEVHLPGGRFIRGIVGRVDAIGIMIGTVRIFWSQSPLVTLK